MEKSLPIQTSLQGKPAWKPAYIWIPVLVGIVLAASFLGYRAWYAAYGPRPIVQVRSPEIEAAYGVRFTLVAGTAANGMIDIRYQVLDPVKAMAMLENPKDLPVVINQASGKQVAVDTMADHRHNLEAGRVYWMLYYNTHSAVRIGDTVNLKVGDYLLKNILVQ